MSANDTMAEFYSDLDDWWAQLWALRIGTSPPKPRVKERFFSYVYNKCQEVSDWKLGDKVLDDLFTDFINHLSGED